MRVAAFFSFSFLAQKAVSPLQVDGEFNMLFRTFFIAFSATRFVFPSEISCAKVASGDSNLCMNLG